MNQIHSWIAVSALPVICFPVDRHLANYVMTNCMSTWCRLKPAAVLMTAEDRRYSCNPVLGLLLARRGLVERGRMATPRLELLSRTLWEAQTCSTAKRVLLVLPR